MCFTKSAKLKISHNCPYLSKVLKLIRIRRYVHEAILYKKLENGQVRCTACKQSCIIKKGHSGLCGVRMNKSGKLYLLVYGKASAVNVDPIEKKPLYHFLPGTKTLSIGTVGCNFTCDFCQNWEMSQVTKEVKQKLAKENKLEDLHLEVGKFGYELLPEQIVSLCEEKGVKSIAYTYNEPTIFFEYLYDTAKLAKEKGIKNVLVSNGYASDDSLEKLKGLVDAINIDLKSFDDEFYKNLCDAKLDLVLETIKKAHDLGIWIEITTLVIPSKNEKDLEKIAKFIARLDENIPWHVSAFKPRYKLKDVASTSAEILAKAHHIGKRAGLKYVYVGNVLDEERSATYCPACNARLISRIGYSKVSEYLNEGSCNECGRIINGIWK